jgi:DNA-binding GntR family transcriptional regulator
VSPSSTSSGTQLDRDATAARCLNLHDAGDRAPIVRAGKASGIWLWAAGRLPRSHGEHDAVVKAILRGDGAAAHEEMLRHVSLVEDAFGRVTWNAPEATHMGRRRPSITAEAD